MGSRPAGLALAGDAQAARQAAGLLDPPTKERSAVSRPGAHRKGAGRGLRLPPEVEDEGVGAVGDGLTDRQETFTHLTDELRFDTDGDGLGDGTEVQHGLDPPPPNQPHPVGPAPQDTTAADGDGGGLGDFEETAIWGTDPNDDNSDNDYYNDGFEASRVGLDPLNPDSDFDGMLDGCDTDNTTPEMDPAVGIVCQG